jgi:hypothetical protein
MTTKTFSVVPIGGGWAVEQASGDPLMFPSGGRAEAKAKQLAELTRRMGGSARVLIHDRNGALVGQKAYGAAPHVVRPNGLTPGQRPRR